MTGLAARQAFAKKQKMAVDRVNKKWLFFCSYTVTNTDPGGKLIAFLFQDVNTPSSRTPATIRLHQYVRN